MTHQAIKTYLTELQISYTKGNATEHSYRGDLGNRLPLFWNDSNLYQLNHNKKKYLKSPLNYIGGKYKILNQIIPLIPKDINCFVDLFARHLSKE